MKNLIFILCTITIGCLICLAGCDAEAGELKPPVVEIPITPIQKTMHIQKECNPVQKTTCPGGVCRGIVVEAPGVTVRVPHRQRKAARRIHVLAPVVTAPVTYVQPIPPGSIVVPQRIGLFGWRCQNRIYCPVR